MGNIADRKSLKKYLDYIGQGVQTIDDEFHPSLNNEYKKKYSTYYNIHTTSSEFFIKVFEEVYKTKPLDEFIYHTSAYCFELILDKKTLNNSALKALGMIFKNHSEDIKPEHYIFMADQYVKNLAKNQEVHCFFNFFDIDKFNKNYLTCIAIATDDNILLKKLAKNYEFNQSEYVYAILHDNEFVVSLFANSRESPKTVKSSFEYSGKPITYGKDIETLFLYQLENGTALDLNKILHTFVHNIEDIGALKNAIKNQEKERNLKSDSYYGNIIKTVIVKDEIAKILEPIEKYELFLTMNNNLSQKPNIKSRKI
jgi:hypothetical protein